MTTNAANAMAGDALRAWPQLPDRVAAQLQLLLDEANNEHEEEPQELIDPDTGQSFTGLVPRPWDLTELQEPLRAAVLGWLDEVVLWLNHTYGWQEEQVIPACWPHHPGLALDLAALAFGRIDAYSTATAAFVGRWHSDWEDVQRRMTTALGESGRDCRRGEHKRPAEYAIGTVQHHVAGRIQPSGESPRAGDGDQPGA